MQISSLPPQTVIIKSEVVKQAASIFGACPQQHMVIGLSWEAFPATQQTLNSLERIHGNLACAAISDVKTSFLVNMKLFGVCIFN